jgi:hypothetical protein
MSPLTISAAIVALYLGTGTLYSWMVARAIVLAIPDKLCSDKCRSLHTHAFSQASDMLTAPSALLVHAIVGAVWPMAIRKQCFCFFRATLQG